MRIENQQLKKFIIDAGLADEAKLDTALEAAKKSKKRFTEQLVEEKILSKDQLAKLQAYILGVPFVDLQKEKIPEETLKIIPESVSRTHNIVSFRKKDGYLEVAMLDPEDLETIDFIKKKSNLEILPRLTNEESIKAVLGQYNKSLESEFSDLIKSETGGVETLKEKTGSSGEDLEKAAEELPVIKIVDTLLKHAVIEKSSDIHIEPTEKEVVVRYRVDGILHDAMVLPKQIASGIVARIKVLSNLKLDEHRLPQDGRFKIQSEGSKISIRVSILPVFFGEKIVMRLLPEQTKVATLGDLGFRPEALKKIQTALKKPLGMNLITGPTGSGKTTTLYTMMDILNTPNVNISTVEDPVEYQMPRINQTQIDAKIGLTFANALRSLLRQDPNVIMVGEIRDNETASLATNAALTGHLVLSTLHTNTAAGAIPRLLDMKIEPFLLASTLNFVMAQRLVRRLTSEKEKYFLAKQDIESLEKYLDVPRFLEILEKEKVIKAGAKIGEIPFYRPKEGVDKKSVYKGRLGIYEVLEVTESIRKLIHDNATTEQIQKKAMEEGMDTMMEDGMVKAAQGITSIEEVYRVISE